MWWFWVAVARFKVQWWMELWFSEEVAFMLTSTIHLGGTQNMFVVPVKATSAQEARAET